MFRWRDKRPQRRTISEPKTALSDEEALKTRPYGYVLEKGAQLFAQHGLSDWRLVLDNARRRAGQCDYRNKTISLSRHYVRYASHDHIEDTLLHEIAHALVGPKHGHDMVWRQKAREIGCTATRCHTLNFSETKWLMKCPNGCFEVERHRRKANLVCMKCKTAIIYEAR